MGVPSFYRWLVNKYPKIVSNAVEKRVDDTTTTFSNPNPNPNPYGIDFDNLYLDMNGIIHPCFHPEDHLSPPQSFEDVFNRIFDYIDRLFEIPSPPQSFEDVFNRIFDYIDRLFEIVRPRNLFYLAIDGVAPRAKMNQQRSRRFRTAKDCELDEAEEDRLLREFEREGKHVFPKQESQISDSNIITPGTRFMHELSKALQSYVDLRLKNDIRWKYTKVILSDANVPGEGEHKIMSFIRLQQTYSDYDPNTRHCIYGLDADLIMLVLATHEVHFSILREDITIPEQSVYQPAQKTNISEVELSLLKTRNVKPYQFLHIWILREYLELDMEILDPPENMNIDLERIIDDFIFICFFMGNDFLPHMPSLEIHEGAIDLLMHVYKKEFKKLGGYLVDMQFAGEEKMRYINLKRVEKFILSVGQKEELIFKKRTELRDRKLRRILSECSSEQEEGGGEFPSDSTSTVVKRSVSTPCETATTINGANSSVMEENTKELKERLKCWSRERLDLFKDGSYLVDKVRFGAPGFKQRYYKEKFSAETKEDIENLRKTLVQKYTEGLCWVLLYYFSGVPSWNWFYNYHYGPFASDLRSMSSVRVIFEKGSPLKPFDQLMGVLPPRSAHALPKVYRELMTNPDSILQDFYPSDFEVDTDGKRFLWQGICKLPFIDEKRLTAETVKLEVELKDDEVIRNSMKNDLLFVRKSNELGQHMFSLSKKKLNSKHIEIIKENIATNLSCGVDGFISPLDEVFSVLRLTGDYSLNDPKDIEEDSVLCVQFQLLSNAHHVPRPLACNLPEKTIYEVDLMETTLWHEHPGNRTNYRPSAHNYLRRTITELQSNSKTIAKGPIHKHAGTGWGAGRGNEFNPITERGDNSSSSAKSSIGYEHEWRGGRGRGYRNQSSDTSGNRQNYRPSQAERGEYVGYSKNLFNSYGKAGQSNVKSWRQPNTASDNSQKCNDQIQRRHFSSNNMNGVHGRGRNLPNDNATSAHWRVRDDSSK